VTVLKGSETACQAVSLGPPLNLAKSAGDSRRPPPPFALTVNVGSMTVCTESFSWPLSSSGVDTKPWCEPPAVTV
jgi:hypothetical protein